MKAFATFASLVVGASATTLVGFNSLHADTFAEGPQSGALLEEKNNRSIPFPSQPVQGFSGAQWSPFAKSRACERFLMMPDNGYGQKTTSPDYLLRIYDIEPNWGTKKQPNVARYIQLSDQDGWFPHPIINENTEHRNLTGGDIDPESFVLAHDATLWVGDEFGPWITQYDMSGRMLAPPVETPEINQETFELNFSKVLRSPNHPQVLDGTYTKTHGSSRGFEGMSFSPDRKFLYPILEDESDSDPQGTSRVYEFSLETYNYTRFVGFIPHSASKLGDATPVNSTHILVIERDGSTDLRGEGEKYKRINLVDLTTRDEKGYLAKTEIVDLLNIQDPLDLNHDGSTTFTFPFQTIEDVLVLTPTTILVANDNNYPETISRAPGDKIDNNEMIKLKLDTPLAYDFNLRRVPKVQC